jgi:transposase
VTDRLQYQPHLALVALDEMSLYFQATLTRVWSPIGQTPVVRISPQRDNIHFYGGVELRTGRELAVTSLEQTADTTADFLRLLLLTFPTQPLLVLLDRAPWHHGSAIDLVLDENPRLTLVYFPPACPDLNPQEHVWEHARDAVGHNHEYACFSTLIDAFDTFLNETPFDLEFMDKYSPPIYASSF